MTRHRSFESVWDDQTTKDEEHSHSEATERSNSIFCDVSIPTLNCDGILMNVTDDSNRVQDISIIHTDEDTMTDFTTTSTGLGLMPGKSFDGARFDLRAIEGCTNQELIGSSASVTSSMIADDRSDGIHMRTSQVRKLCTGLMVTFQNTPALIQIASVITLATILGVVLFCATFVLMPAIVLFDTSNSTESLQFSGKVMLSTVFPSQMPTSMPSAKPSSEPSSPPSMTPSVPPSDYPSVAPSFGPSARPSESPSAVPSSSPSNAPSPIPSSKPSALPSSIPSVPPSLRPSTSPSASMLPSNSPSALPSFSPTSSPSQIPSKAPTTASPTYKPLIFYVMGDAPYNEEEAEEMTSQIANIPGDAEFVVHVGDIQRATRTGCAESAYAGVRDILRTCQYPLFILPGDNDVLDCPNKTQGLAYFRQYFGSFESNWSHSLQVDRLSTKPENFAFFLDGVLFLGLDTVVGFDDDAVAARTVTLDSDLLWTLSKINEFRNQMECVIIFAHYPPKDRHEAFFGPLFNETSNLGIPTLYMHGNGHEWEYEENAFNTTNVIRVQVDRGGRAAPLRVKYRRGSLTPFQFTRRM